MQKLGRLGGIHEIFFLISHVVPFRRQDYIQTDLSSQTEGASGDVVLSVGKRGGCP